MELIRRYKNITELKYKVFLIKNLNYFQRGLFLSSQEIPLTNTLIRMSSNNNEVIIFKKKCF